VNAYGAAFSITQNNKYKDVVDDILLYVSRDMTHKMGGFFSAEDADSHPVAGDKEKKEGAFCVWTWDQVHSLLADKPIEGSEKTLADVVVHEYNMEEGGNVDARGDPHGELLNQNVLTKIPVKSPLITDSDKYKAALTEANKILFSERLTRPRPGLDIKIVSCWNSQMISSFCKAATVTENKDYLETALKAGQFLRNTLWCDSKRRLLRCVYGNKENISNLEDPIEGFVDDYCLTVAACIDLYSATFDETWLRFGIQVQEVQDELFLDRENGGYFTSRQGDPEIVIRLKDDQDGAEPSSNSVSTMNLFRLGRILNKSEYSVEAEKIIKLYAERMIQIPHGLPAMVEAYLHHHQDNPILVVAGDTEKHSLLRHIHTNHYPSYVIIKPGELIDSCFPGLKDLEKDRNGVYFLKNEKLSELITEVDQFKEILKSYNSE